MKPMFFGDSQRKLYGVYDAPYGPQRRSHAVLLCYPGVQEYGSSMWGFRRLSNILAQAGHHVLRFDYYGTGDSAGRADEGTLTTWVEDVAIAAQELRELSSARQLSIVGKRLGAAIAVKACQKGLDAQRLLLWDPVVNGSNYVSELEMWDARRNLLLLHAERRGPGRTELLGYPFPDSLRRELDELRLDRELPPVQKVKIFGSDNRAVHGLLESAYRAGGLQVELTTVTEGDGQEAGAQGRAQLSGTILGEMASELSQVLAA